MHVAAGVKGGVGIVHSLQDKTGNWVPAIDAEQSRTKAGKVEGP